MMVAQAFFHKGAEGPGFEPPLRARLCFSFFLSFISEVSLIRSF